MHSLYILSSQQCLVITMESFIYSVIVLEKETDLTWIQQNRGSGVVIHPVVVSCCKLL